jgi:uncharacterized protein with NRDE domain
MILCFVWWIDPDDNTPRLFLASSRNDWANRPYAPMNWQDDSMLIDKDTPTDGTTCPCARVSSSVNLTSAGSWIGVAKSGRFAVVLPSYHKQTKNVDKPLPRARLVPRFLKSEQSPAEFIAELHHTVQATSM